MSLHEVKCPRRMQMTREDTQEAYDENVFRYFLQLEQRRSERSGRPCLLLLVTLEEHDDARRRGVSLVPGDLMRALRLNLRETDIIGWYRRDQVAGAVLTQPGDPVDWREVRRVVYERVSGALGELSGEDGNSPPVRIRPLPLRQATAGSL